MPKTIETYAPTLPITLAKMKAQQAIEQASASAIFEEVVGPVTNEISVDPPATNPVDSQDE